MKKALIIIGITSAVLLMGATVVGYQDWQLRGSTPPSPASGWLRMWADTTAGKFKCLTSAGVACYFDSSAGGLTLQTGGASNGSQTALNLVAGSNVTLTNSGANVTIDSSGSGSGGTTIFSGNGNPNGVGAQFSPTNMTSNSAPSPLVVSTTAGDFNGHGGWVVFSLTANQYVTGSGAPQSLTLDLGAGASFILGSYKILNATSGSPYAPIAWTMAGSNDGSTFTTVDTRAGQSFTGGVYNPYTPTTTTTAYRYFRINITSAAGGGSWGMTALQLFAFATPVISGSAGDWYFETSTKQLYGPRPSGSTPVWPLMGTLN
jgi:hypothetical protein